MKIRIKETVYIANSNGQTVIFDYSTGEFYMIQEPYSKILWKTVDHKWHDKDAIIHVLNMPHEIDSLISELLEIGVIESA